MPVRLAARWHERPPQDLWKTSHAVPDQVVFAVVRPRHWVARRSNSQPCASRRQLRSLAAFPRRALPEIMSKRKVPDLAAALRLGANSLHFAGNSRRENPMEQFQK